MKLVEVIDGVRGAPAVGDAMMALARRMGHVPVRAKDTPGFIVNHAGRGYGTEALRVLGENVAAPHVIDAVLREQAGFKLGPFELLDLTGLDVSVPVMESIYHQYFEEPRFRPSPLAAQRRVAGLLGRKTGEGWYRHVDGRQVPVPDAPVPDARPASVWISAARPASGLREHASCWQRWASRPRAASGRATRRCASSPRSARTSAIAARARGSTRRARSASTCCLRTSAIAA